MEEIKKLIEKWIETHEKEAQTFRDLVIRHDEKLQAIDRYFIPLSRKGKIAIAIGLHRDIKDVIPKSTKQFLIPIYNWLSRLKTRVKLSFSSFE